MTDNLSIIETLTGKIAARLVDGFIPDNDSRHFLRTGYGVNSDEEMLAFLNDSSINDGTFYELTFYPDTAFRITVEKIIPARGLSAVDIEQLSLSMAEFSQELTVNTGAGVHTLDRANSAAYALSFIKKLHLNLNLSCLGEPHDPESVDLYTEARSILRSRNFIPSADRGSFMKLLLQHKPLMDLNADIILLVERSISLLAGTEGKVFDALAAKKYYYESVISQTEEFAALLKNWGMEFLMMKRIQPPAVSIDDAVESIRAIDRLTSIVYGVIIPPSDVAVQMRINRGDPATDFLI